METKHLLAVVFLCYVLPVASVLLNIRPFRMAITQAHNYYRRMEPAANMREMLIWATTRRVGCAISYCPLMRSGGGSIQRNAMYFVCFYSPAGNYIGQYPFIVGPRCSRCGRGESCNRGLCSRYRFFGRRRRRSAKDEFVSVVTDTKKTST